MNHDKLSEAMTHISGKYLKEAGQSRKRHTVSWMSAAAAVLAAAILISALFPRTPAAVPGPTVSPSPTHGEVTAIPPSVALKNLVASPVYPQMAARPLGDYDHEAYTAWQQSIADQRSQPVAYAGNLQDFFTASMARFLDEEDNENPLCSPLNIYMALALLAQTCEGDSRQQILDALNAESMDSLRTQAGHVWNAHYLDDGASKTLLANSLWIDDSFVYNEETADILANGFYASVFHGDTDSAPMNQALQGWLNENTGGLLSEQVSKVSFPRDTLLALASTIYFKGGWATSFDPARTTEDLFHSPDGDVTAAFMHRTNSNHSYYWGEDFTAINLELTEGNRMWLILPEEGTTPRQLLENGDAPSLALGDWRSWKDKKNLTVHMDIPKFDVSSQLSLYSGMTAMGIEDVWSKEDANFGGISQDPRGLYLAGADHAARVVIDEEGALGAAYTVMYMLPTSAPVPSKPEEIRFTLDRPFLFIITSQDDLPLFAGIVNQP